MTKKILLAVLVVLFVAGVALAADPYGPARKQLQMNEGYMDYMLNNFGINHYLVEDIIWSKLDGYVFTDAFKDDEYVWWFKVQGERASFCVSCPQTNDYAYVAVVDDNTWDSVGFKLVINGQIEVRITQDMTFNDMFKAVSEALRQVAPNGYKDGWAYLALKMLLEILQIYYP